MKNLIVMDDFYKDPWAVRDYALNRADYLTENQLPPGFAGTESLRGFYSQNLVQKMEKAIGKEIDVNPKQFAFGVFSKTFAADETKKAVHVDGSDWTAVLYLSRPEDCRGGSVFYENRRLGWTELPSLEGLQSRGYSSKQNFIEGDLKKWSQDFSQWRVSCRVGMKFNRMVLFKAGSMFHAAEGYFGNHDQNCRLLQLFFFKAKEEQK